MQEQHRLIAREVAYGQLPHHPRLVLNGVHRLFGRILRQRASGDGLELDHQPSPLQAGAPLVVAMPERPASA